MVDKTHFHHRSKYCNLDFPKLDKMAREIITKMGRNKRRIVPNESRTILESRKANIKRDYNRLISPDGKYVRRRPYYTGDIGIWCYLNHMKQDTRKWCQSQTVRALVTLDRIIQSLGRSLFWTFAIVKIASDQETGLFGLWLPEWPSLPTCHLFCRQ